MKRVLKKRVQETDRRLRKIVWDKRRSNTEIYADVLRAVAEGHQKPTRIMYQANMSWTPINRILNNLVENGLLEVKDVSGEGDRRSSRRYSITRAGLDAIKSLDSVRELLNFE